MDNMMNKFQNEYEAVFSKIEFTKKKSLTEGLPNVAILSSALNKISEGTELSAEEKAKLRSSLEYTFKKDYLAFDFEKETPSETTKKGLAMIVLHKNGI